MEKDIAVIGIACRAAGANSPVELWENLLQSTDVQRRITRFNTRTLYRPGGAHGTDPTKADCAYMLDDDVVDKFDNAFFHITPTEAIAMDPQHRMLLEVSYEAIENAGIPLQRFAETDTAVFTGMSTFLSKAAEMTDMRPSMSVDTACSSSMAALHQAVRALQHGNSTMALVCGANLNINPESFVSMSELGFLSSSGRCCSFDARAGGYGRGEAIDVLVLKPLQKAIADSDPIRAVIKGTRLNQDGRTQGITLPSAKAQQENMKTLYKEIAVDPSTIQYLEAHGTGTAAGDPIELQAINAVYASNPLIIGSVKSNVGHCEAASALMGLIKTVICLENAQIPPQMQFENPNPTIDFTNRTIPVQILSWPDTDRQVRRAAINTFGAGGTNGHAVLEAYEDNHESPKSSNEQRPWLFKLSAADEKSLKTMIEAYIAYIKQRRPNLGDLAHTLTAHRSNFKYSRVVVASNQETLCTQFESVGAKALTGPSRPVKQTLFIFTGQGGQW
ncbi:MAG: hypothetical protein LQ343_002508 [Gyalolechia ehrenbergii]|nr:MAG: hypothetical protein LQ343_002508 [Gyalolechia ehrenbergii]